MNAILEELGKPLTPKEAALIIGIDVNKVRKLYATLGGVRIGQRQIIFYERRLVDAISKLQQEQQREIPMARAGNNASAGRNEEAASASVPNKKRSPTMGGRGKGENGFKGKSGAMPHDPHGVLA